MMMMRTTTMMIVCFAVVCSNAGHNCDVRFRCAAGDWTSLWVINFLHGKVNVALITDKHVISQCSPSPRDKEVRRLEGRGSEKKGRRGGRRKGEWTEGKWENESPLRNIACATSWRYVAQQGCIIVKPLLAASLKAISPIAARVTVAWSVRLSVCSSYQLARVKWNY